MPRGFWLLLLLCVASNYLEWWTDTKTFTRLAHIGKHCCEWTGQRLYGENKGGKDLYSPSYRQRFYLRRNGQEKADLVAAVHRRAFQEVSNQACWWLKSCCCVCMQLCVWNEFHDASSCNNHSSVCAVQFICMFIWCLPGRLAWIAHCRGDLIQTKWPGIGKNLNENVGKFPRAIDYQFPSNRVALPEMFFCSSDTCCVDGLAESLNFETAQSNKMLHLPVVTQNPEKQSDSNHWMYKQNYHFLRFKIICKENKPWVMLSYYVD